jgi:hypothetical protein
MPGSALKKIFGFFVVQLTADKIYHLSRNGVSRGMFLKRTFQAD